MVLKITVKTLDSQNYQLEAQDNWTVLQFKEHIQETVGVTSNEQRLIFCGRVLQNDKKLIEYDCDGKVMHLVRRPPPSIDNQDHDSSVNDRLHAEGGSTPGNNETFRFGDEGNILLSTMAIGTDNIGNINPADLVRQVMSLQQAVYNRTFAGASTTATIALEGRLNNLHRLTSITAAQISEINNRIRQITSPSRPTMTVGLSQTDLPRDNETQATDTTAPAPLNIVAQAVNLADDWHSTSSNENVDTTLRAQHRRLSMTTDDLPRSSSTSRLASSFTQGSSIPEPNVPASGSRPDVPMLDRYMTLVNSAYSLQDQVQTLMGRYRDILIVSRRGGLIVTNQNQNQATASAPSQDDSEYQTNQARSNNPTDSNPSTPQISSVIMQEARILSAHLPRIMHSISHVFHALSDFSVDVTNGSLNSGAPTIGQGLPIFERQTTRRISRRAHTHSNNNSSDSNTADQRFRSPVLDGSVIITATTVATPILSTSTTTSGLQPQAGATIVVTSEPGQTGVHIPTPFNEFNPRDILNFATPQVPPPTQEQSRDSSASRQRDPAQQSNLNDDNSQQQQRRQETTSTQTSSRPVGFIPGNIMPPFDYYLMCCSPYANSFGQNLGQQGARQTTSQGSDTRAQFRMPRMRPHTGTEPEAQQSHAQHEQTAEQATNPSLNSSLTEVVNNILESIFRPAEQPHLQAESSVQHQDHQTNQLNQGPILNMIPELAINAASQILGEVFGLQTPQQQQQSRTNSSTTQPAATNQQRSRGGTVMMDIDIDDSSSSQSDSRYHDACDTSRAPQAQQPTASPSDQQSSLSERPSLSRLDLPSTSGRPTVGQAVPLDHRSREQLINALRNHPDWLPIIEADINFIESQMSNANSNLPHFSDAYLNSIPRKRRRLLTATPDRVLILQPTPSEAITNLLRRAVASSNVLPNVDSLDPMFASVASDPDLQTAYEEHVKSAVEARLRSDDDFKPEKFENSNKYFNS